MLRCLSLAYQRDAPSMRAYHHQYDANVVEAARLEKVTNDTVPSSLAQVDGQPGRSGV